jgi:hypothetical protein
MRPLEGSETIATTLKCRMSTTTKIIVAVPLSHFYLPYYYKSFPRSVLLSYKIVNISVGSIEVVGVSEKGSESSRAVAEEETAAWSVAEGERPKSKRVDGIAAIPAAASPSSLSSPSSSPPLLLLLSSDSVGVKTTREVVVH